MRTDTSEKGLETLIVEHLTGRTTTYTGGMAEDPQPFIGLHHWILGNPRDYDRACAVDLAQLRAFIAATQPKLVEPLDLDNDTPTRQKFLARLQGEITRHGIIHVLRKGIQHQQHHVTLYFATASVGNDKAAALHNANRFSVTRQLRYSESATSNSLDLCIFINGLPLATFDSRLAKADGAQRL